MASPIIRAAAIEALLKPRAHPLDTTKVRVAASLGDQVGLTKVGIHKNTLAPHTQGTVVHFHDVDDEWFYIVRGGGTLLFGGQGEDAEVSAGDFMGFSAEPVDVCHYPLINKTMVINRASGKNTVFDESNGANWMPKD
ncbi:hypothetical protein B0H10DRAFT_2065115 [Mycena sp. CBHHK59/15]|nr:hypothetical protein B0H10DRAFT_2065115 [Mycena sp. CBHHK59/15]